MSALLAEIGYTRPAVQQGAASFATITAVRGGRLVEVLGESYTSSNPFSTCWVLEDLIALQAGDADLIGSAASFADRWASYGELAS